MHVLASVKQTFSDVMLHFHTLRLTQRHLRQTHTQSGHCKYAIPLIYAILGRMLVLPTVSSRTVSVFVNSTNVLYTHEIKAILEVRICLII